MDLAFVGLAINSVAIAAITIHQYITGKTYDLIANFANTAATLLLACALLAIFAFMIPVNPETGGAIASLSWLLCIPAGLVFLYLLSRLKSNESVLSYLLFALLVAQQVWHTYSAESPHSAIMLLALVYIAFAIAIITLGGLAGIVLAAVFPKSEQGHRDWINSTLSDKYYEKRPIPFEVRFILDRATAAPLSMRIFNNPVAIRSNDWGTPADIASGLIVYALLNPIVFSFFFIYA
jgi:hypothetical protein